MIRIGTSGNPPNFFSSKFINNRLNCPEWLNSIGLNALEIMFTYGARTSEQNALQMGINAKKFDVQLSVHSPYYVVLTSNKKKVIKNSFNEMLKTLKLSDLMHSKTAVLHPGFMNVNDPIGRVIKNLNKINEKAKQLGYKTKIALETMGKTSQLGSFDHIIQICKETKCIPCIDFAHVHARTFGSLKTKKDFRIILEKIEKELGKKFLRNLHCHFYPVYYGDKGEKSHAPFKDKKALPHFEPFAELIKEFKMHPTLISEFKDSQDLGANFMKKQLKKIGYLK
ncbi:MAG: TIM barrel protein [Candidatus Pacearchaeota archaeon]|nr:MAG: TIM barrel protein [Candidatus Pacearchaeota archaeon]